MRRTLIAVSSLTLVATGAFVLPSLSQAASGTGVYGVWTASGGTGEVTFPNSTFPGARFTSVDSTQTVAKSQTLIASSPFGLQYGTSRGSTYLLTAVASGQTTGSVTLTFDSAPIAGTWGLALGDVDAENVTVTAKDSSGRRLNMNEFYIESFNTATGQTDMPTWDPKTETLMGSGVDTQGASAWFTPSGDVKSITLTQKKLSGFPQYALWIATDVEQPTPVASATSSSAAPAASVSASPSPTAAPTIPAAPVGKVVICHRTASKQNPYVRITISQDAVISGHDGHNGGLYPTPGWGDIIPPFPGFSGQNWPTGGAILDNECDIPAASPASAAPTSTMTSGASESASASTSASASLLPSSSASPSATVSLPPAPTQTLVPKPTETITPDLPEPIPAPIGDTLTITTEDLPGVPKNAVIIDVKKPDHGDAVVDNGQVLYTPERGYDGPVELIVIVKERDGSVTQVDVPLETGKSQFAVNLKLPDELLRGSNVLNVNNLRTNAKQRAKVTVTCVPVNRMKPIGGIAACEVMRIGGKVFVDSRSASKVTVSLSAPAKGKYLPYREVVIYRIR